MKDLVPVSQEHADSRLLAAQVVGEGGLLELGAVPVVVLDGSDRLVRRDVEVVVEFAAERGIPGMVEPMRVLNASILSMGARETRTSEVSRACRWARWPMPSIRTEQTLQPSSQLGSNMAWYTISCRRPSKRSSRLALPAGPWKTYSLSTATIGRRRRSALRASRAA